MDEMTDGEVEEEVREIVKESIEMGDYDILQGVDGQCSRCDREAVWRDPVSEKQFCEEHAKEYFRDRH